MDEAAGHAGSTPEGLLAEYVFAQESGEAPRIEAYASRLGDPQQRGRLLALHETLVGLQRALPVRMRSRTLLGGRYRLLQVLGRGGFAKVWLAADERLDDRRVAVKVFEGPASSTAQRANLEREKHALARLQHPGIVQILDVGEHDASPFLVMELVMGITLADLVQRLRAPGPDPSPPAAAAIAATLGTEVPRSWWHTAAATMLPVLDALQAAHDIGLVHRDIKPANIMRRSDGTVVLLDFGIARDEALETSTLGGLAGTLAFLSPEQTRGGKNACSPRSDVYQAGLVLYELLTLQAAIAPTMAIGKLLECIRDGRYPAPRHRAKTIPADLEAICLNALERAPERRYPTAQAFREDLEDFLAGLPPRHVPTTGLATATRAVRRSFALHRLAIGGSATLLVGAVLGFAAFATAHGGVGGIDGIVRNDRTFAADVDVAIAGELFGYVAVHSAVDLEIARIPLLTTDGAVSMHVAAGRQRVAMQLPSRCRLAADARLTVRFQTRTGAAADQQAEFHRRLLTWIVDPIRDGASGVPLAKAQELAALAGRDPGAAVAPASLLGDDWPGAAVR